MIISKQQMQTIVDNAPKEVDTDELQVSLLKDGHTIEGVDTQQAIDYYNKKKGIIPETPQVEKPGIVKQIAGEIARPITQGIARTGQALGLGIAELSGNEELKKRAYENVQKPMTEPLTGTEIPGVKQFGQGGGEQIAGQAIESAALLFPYGRVAKGVGMGAEALGVGSKLAKTTGNVISGATGAYTADVGYDATQGKTLGEVITPGAITAIGTAVPLVDPALRAVKGTKTLEDVTKKVIQGQTKDIPLAEKAFANVDLSKIKSRKELSDTLSNKMNQLMDEVDLYLSRDQRKFKPEYYAIRQTNSAGQEVTTDVVSNALNHLKEFYTKSGDNLMASNIDVLEQKAVQEGLTHQEVNDIARKYSEEFGSKAFNKIGDPLTSVNAQLFENTRSGLKQAARGGLGYGKEAQRADYLYHAMENTKRLIDTGVEKVNQLEGKLKDYNIVQKLSRTAVKALNALTGGSLKAGVEALGVSNVGNKINNWVDLERSLKKDLEFIQKANGTKSEKSLIDLIENWAKNVKSPGDYAVDELSQSKLLPNQRIRTDIPNSTSKKSNISNTIQQKKNQVNKVINTLKNDIKNNGQKGSAEVFKNEGNLTTKILKDLEGKTTVSKQYILDATNRGELKQVERDITRQVLDDMTRNKEEMVTMYHASPKMPTDGNWRKGTMFADSESNARYYAESHHTGDITVKKVEIPKSLVEKNKTNNIYNLKEEYPVNAKQSDTINVKEFADKVKSELLPLDTFSSYIPKRGETENYSKGFSPRYESITLPSKLRGKIKDYKENIYQSPVKTSAGNTHFSNDSDNYFGHTRIEDMADNKTRRVIEVQSDLYQKGNLEKEVNTRDLTANDYGLSEIERYKKEGRKTISSGGKEIPLAEAEKIVKKQMAEAQSKVSARQSEISKLQQYNDPTAHFRMIREEIKKASQDSKTKLQFPTGETAMKIEGLGTVDGVWYQADTGRNPINGRLPSGDKLTPENLKVGNEVIQNGGDNWIITDVLGDGKFKAVPKDKIIEYQGTRYHWRNLPEKAKNLLDRASEEFDISGKVDTNNPIYKFYEKDVQKYLNKFGGKRVVDNKGVSWIEIPITKEMGQQPVEAFGKAKIGTVGKVAGATALGALGTNLYARKNGQNITIK